MTRVVPALRRGVAAAGELVLPARCAACHRPDAPLCGRCTAAVRTASAGGPFVVRLAPASTGMPCCLAGARFEGALRLAVTAYKDEDRRDLRPVLAGVLAGALGTALSVDPVLRRRRAHGNGVLVVPLPTAGRSRRRRGDDPVADLARAAVDAVGGGRGDRPGMSLDGLVVALALTHTRSVADQAHLDRGSRAANLAGAITVRGGWRAVVQGAVCVLVDDVVTTGATLGEGARALREAGAVHVVAATMAATPRRFDPPLWVTGPPTSVRS